MHGDSDLEFSFSADHFSESERLYILAGLGIIGDIGIEPLLQYAVWKTVGGTKETA